MGDGKTPIETNESTGVALSLGFGIALSLAVFVGGGVWLDSRFETSPIWTFVGLVIGLVAAGYQLYELALASRKDQSNGPIGRVIQRRMNHRT